jgi:hypothetical protein
MSDKFYTFHVSHGPQGNQIIKKQEGKDEEKEKLRKETEEGTACVQEHENKRKENEVKEQRHKTETEIYSTYLVSVPVLFGEPTTPDFLMT